MSKILRRLALILCALPFPLAAAEAGKCKLPITYALGDVASEFGVSQAQFRQAVSIAAEFWNRGFGKPLIKELPTSQAAISINMIYTDKQKIFSRLLEVKEKGEALNKWHSDYQLVSNDLKVIVGELEKKTLYFNQRSRALESKIQSWNRLGPKSGYTKEQIAGERAQLVNEREELVAMQTKYNREITNLQQIAGNLKSSSQQLSGEYSLVKAAKDNVLGFNRAGVYQRTTAGETISIFLHDDQKKLVLTLAHEFGHALGIRHVNNPAALMNTDMSKHNDSMTALHAADIAALKAICSNL